MSPRTRRLLLIAVPAFLAALGVGLWLLWPRTAITPENAAKIQPGMALAEVEAILGGPARDEGPEQRTAVNIQSVRPDREWNSAQVSVWVFLDAEGRVRDCRAILVPRAPRPLDRLRRWLGL
jgi:hypothetical protein